MLGLLGILSCSFPADWSSPESLQVSWRRLPRPSWQSKGTLYLECQRDTELTCCLCFDSCQNSQKTCHLSAKFSEALEMLKASAFSVHLALATALGPGYQLFPLLVQLFLAHPQADSLCPLSPFPADGPLVKIIDPRNT